MPRDAASGLGAVASQYVRAFNTKRSFGFARRDKSVVMSPVLVLDNIRVQNASPLLGVILIR